MRPSRPTDPAARFACRRAAFTEFTAFARDPAPPLAPRPPRAGRLCALPRPA
ncbi:aldehyde dehydrogenase [Burkholderia lata]|nr:aldehyde dehydrogenase [Burkholderia lata]